MGRPRSLTEGNIFSSLIRFAVPVLFTLFLQALYGGVDLLVVGQFAQTADVSGVATGSMLLQTVTMVVTGLSMGITILVGERIGRREPEDAGRAIGGGICLFACFAVLLTAVLVGGAEVLARLMHAPEHAFHQTVLYIRICGAGSLFIVAYNVLGSIFRGIGDSRTPLLTVAIACVINIFGDLLLVAGFHMGAAGAALAAARGVALAVQKLHALGLDFRGVTVLALLILPFACLQTAFHIDKAALGKVIGAVFSLALKHGHTVPFGAFHLVAVAVGIGFVGGHVQTGYRRAALGVAQFGVAAQAADDHDFIQHGCRSG